MDFVKLILCSKILGEESLVILNLINWWKNLRWFVYVLEKKIKIIFMIIFNLLCLFIEKRKEIYSFDSYSLCVFFYWGE